MSTIHAVYHKLIYVNTATPASIGSGSHQFLQRTGALGTNFGVMQTATAGILELAPRCFLGPIPLYPECDFAIITGYCRVLNAGASGATCGANALRCFAVGEPLFPASIVPNLFGGGSTVPDFITRNEAGVSLVADLFTTGTAVMLPIVPMLWAQASTAKVSMPRLDGSDVSTSWPFHSDGTAVATGDQAMFSFRLFPPTVAANTTSLDMVSALDYPMPYKNAYVVVKFVPGLSLSLTSSSLAVAVVATGFRYATRQHPEESSRAGTSRVTREETIGL